MILPWRHLLDDSIFSNFSVPQDAPSQVSRANNETVEGKTNMLEKTPSWKVQDTLHGM